MARSIRLAAVALLVVLTGCAGGKDPAPSPSTMGEEQIVAVLRELTQCMHDHGVPQYPEPRIVDGKVHDAPVEVPPGQEATADAAWQACEPIAQRVPRELWLTDTPTAEELETLRRFAECMRQHGFPDWPDPDSDGAFPVGGTVMGQKSELEGQARRACRDVYDGGVTVKEATR